MTCVALVHQSPLAAAQEASDVQQQVAQLQKMLVDVQLQSRRELETLQRQTDERIQALQHQIAQLKLAGNQAGETAKPQTLTAQVNAATAAGPDETPAPESKFSAFGDFRLRYETNSSDGPIPSWNRWVLRGRLAGRYALNDNVELGARLVTGDPDNPRTADVTLGDFGRDFEVSLDQAYLAYTNENLLLTGGKFAKPFSSTELVWDGDVNPQGLGGYLDFFQHDTWSMRFSGIYFIIDNQVLENGSDMLGGQLSLSIQPASNWELAAHVSYYDYDLGPLDPLVPGGARGNTLTPDGRYYLNDYDLLDIFGTLSYTGFGEHWKVWLIADYVKNLGADTPQDTGYEFDLFAGSLKRRGNFLFHYGYAQTHADAVMGLYSNDNIVYATNYQMHTFSADYALGEHSFIGLTNYLYRRLEPDPLSPYDNGWVSRTRLNLYFTF